MQPDHSKSKPIPEEHKMNALSQEFQANLNISSYPSMSYPNYYPNFNEFQYSYPPPPFIYPNFQYKYGGMSQQPKNQNFYQNENKPFNSKKPKKDFMNMNEKSEYQKYVPTEKPENDIINQKYTDDLFEKARFFIIKSYNEENFVQAVRYNIWSSTPSHNEDLNKVYLTSTPVILFFSVNGSGHFYGVAHMSSDVLFNQYFEGWSQKDKWIGVFEIDWIYIKDIPNKEFKEIRNPLNLNKPVHNSRDCQEVPTEEGLKVIKIFEKYQSGSSILSKIKG